jgi:hypothetical protein
MNLNNKIKYLMFPEGVDSGAAVENDPLSVAAGGVDTSYPVLSPDRLLRFEVKSAKKVRNEEKATEHIELKLKLLKESTFTDGKPAREGYVVTERVGITPSEKYDIEAIKKGLAKWLQGVLGIAEANKVSLRQFVDNPSILDGKVFDGKTSIRKDKSGNFPDQSGVTPVPPA